MRIKLLYILSSVLLLAAVSCSQEIVPELPVEEGGITLILHNMVPQTKTQPGVEDLNENLIKTIHYFFYPKDGTDQNTEKEPAIEGVYTGLSSQVNHLVRINVSEDLLKNTLFKYPYNDCDVYVIVNLPDVVLATASDHKLSTLRSMVVNANFNSSLEQEAFVMEGLGTASIIDRRKVLAASGTIDVSRLASKITVGVKVKESVETMDNLTSTNGQVWTSKPQDMLIELVNGASVAVLSGDPTMVENQKLDTLDNQQRIFSDLDNDKIWTCAQFYSYPSTWDIGSDEEPYLRITLPWETTYDKNVNGEPIPYVDVQTCVYKVILGGEKLTRNTWYDLTIDIGILGNFENQEEVLLPIENTNYFVADWSTGKTISSEILGGRYLVVDQEEYIIYNENTLSIPFTSSHTCEIVDMATTPVKNQATITYPDYSKETPNEDAPYAWNSNNWYIGVEGSEIVFRHAMRNDISAGKGNYDYAPYTIKFRIRHADQQGRDIYYKDITIIQYPALIVKADKNEGGNIVTDSQTSNDDKGYVFVNGNQLYSGDDWQVVRSCKDGGNNNPNMYVITATISTGDFVIADARQTSPTSAATLGLGNNTVSYYYQSLTDELSHNIIAPSFRMASSYGKCGGTITKAEAVRRCAAYQEDGFPAGRWRVPTLGEMKFIATLSYDSVIPQLFTSGSRYWTSAGAVTYNDNITLNNNTSAYVRCVYDEWYWKNSSQPTVNKAVFTWGDEQR